MCCADWKDEVVSPPIANRYGLTVKPSQAAGKGEGEIKKRGERSRGRKKKK